MAPALISVLPSGRSTKRNAPVALTLTDFSGSLRLVTVIFSPGEGAMAENRGFLGRSMKPPLPVATTEIGKAQASPAAKISGVGSTGVGGALVAEGIGARSAAARTMSEIEVAGRSIMASFVGSPRLADALSPVFA